MIFRSPKPQTPNPKPQTPNPKPQTPIRYNLKLTTIMIDSYMTAVLHRSDRDRKDVYFTLASRSTHACICRSDKRGIMVVASAINHRSIVSCLLNNRGIDSLDNRIDNRCMDMIDEGMMADELRKDGCQTVHVSLNPGDQSKYFNQRYHEEYLSTVGVVIRFEVIKDEVASFKLAALREGGFIEIYDVRNFRLKPLLKYKHPTERGNIPYFCIVPSQDKKTKDLLFIRKRSLIHLNLKTRKEIVLFTADSPESAISHCHLSSTTLFAIHRDSSISSF